MPVSTSNFFLAAVENPLSPQKGPRILGRLLSKFVELSSTSVNHDCKNYGNLSWSFLDPHCFGSVSRREQNRKRGSQTWDPALLQRWVTLRTIERRGRDTQAKRLSN